TFTTVAIANTVQGAVQTFSPFSAMNTRETPNENGNGDGIYLQDNTGTFTVNGGTITSSGDNAIDIFDAGGITISGVTIDGSANTAVQATRVAGLSIVDSMIRNFGNATAVSTARENAISLREVTGAINLQRSTIDTGFGFVFERFAQLPENIGLELNNISAAPATLTVTGSTIKKLDFEGMQIRYQDSNVTVRVDGSTADGANVFNLINGAAINFGQTAADGGSTGTLVVNDSNLTDIGIGTRVGNLSNTTNTNSVTNVRLEDNVITRTFAEGFRLRGFGGPQRSTFNMRIIDNDIFDVGRAVSTVGGAGQTGAGNGIESLLEDRIDARILIDGNTIDDVTPDAGSLGVNIRTTDGTDLDLVFTNNMVLDVGNPTQGGTGSPTGIVEIGAFANSGEPNPDTCVHFTGNTLTPRPSTPAIFSNLFLDDTSPAAKYILQGLITGGDSFAASTFLDMSNTWPPAQFPGITVGVANLLDAHASETCSTPPLIP
ncbi:MAG: hypothetical protein KJO17_05860, partial [Acidimicrobiia bacterium]|nr:hypothetical protein [Acidimicrobiia bacterium]